MKFSDACTSALQQSNENPGCSIHVNGRICLDRNGEPVVDKDGFTVSDWYGEGSTVVTYINGKMRHD